MSRVHWATPIESEIGTSATAQAAASPPGTHPGCGGRSIAPSRSVEGPASTMQNSSPPAARSMSAGPQSGLRHHGRNAAGRRAPAAWPWVSLTRLEAVEIDQQQRDTRLARCVPTLRIPGQAMAADAAGYRRR